VTAAVVAWIRRHADASMAAGLTAAAIALGVPAWRDSALVAADAAGLVAVCALVWWRRRYPIAVAVAAGLLLGVPALNRGGAIVGDEPVTVPAGAAAFLIALALGTQRPWARSLAGLVPLTAGLAVPAGQFNPFLLTVTIGPWLAGLTVASRQRAADQLARRVRELAEEREVFAAASVRYERARIARELHDILAHNLSLIVVQANAGAYLAGTDPDGATEAFGAISQTAALARDEITGLAALLPDTAAPAAPAGLEIVDDLVGRARTAGLHITYRVAGDVAGLPTGTAEAIHRVIQEAMTNAVKHAPGAGLTVELHGRDDRVEVTVHNAAPPATVPAATLSITGGGRGLAGMRDRVHRQGGEVHAGPAGDGGWDVTARLPRHAEVTAP
jgi:signal transduction histidine kinase